MAILNNNAIVGASGQSTGPFKIERSLRFNSADTANLNRTFSSSGNRRTWTWSGWVKRALIESEGTLFSGSPNASNYSSFSIGRSSGNRYLRFFNVSTTLNLDVITSSVYRDASAWYHIVLAVDTTQATDSNKVKIYVNGVQVTAFGTATYPSQNTDLVINQNCSHTIGKDADVSGSYLDGYLTEVHFIDGSAKTPSDFGETDTDTGVWKPKAYSGSYGTNGFYLKFADNSGTTSTTLGKDSSGNGNNWTPNNFSVTAGVGNDSLVDTPTPYGTDTGAGGEVRGNYCTMNPLDCAGTITLSNGNLNAAVASGGASKNVRSTIFPTTGKWYWETTVNSLAGNVWVGIATAAIALDSGAALDQTGGFSYGSNGNFYRGGTSDTTPNTYTANDVIGCAWDVDARSIQFYKNGSSEGTLSSLTAATYSPAFTVTSGSDSISVNFGQRPFAYTAPSGFKALCTQNLPTPTIGATATTRADDYFNTVLYTGNGSNPRGITGVGFQPDFVWLKNRSAGWGHRLSNAVVGANYALESNNTNAELFQNEYGYLTSFNSDGFTVTAGSTDDYYTNNSGDTYVAWNWKANGAGSSNTAGSITSTVSANTTAGFSIVTYTGTGANATVGHGLGVAPSMLIVKRRDVSDDWDIWHTSIGGGTKYMVFTTQAVLTATNIWNSTAPTSSVFSVGTHSSTNASGGTYVAYVFAPVAGYSAFGSYTGNGSTDGPFIYTGFRPKFVLIKRTDSSGSWNMKDTARAPYNADGYTILAEDSAAEFGPSNTLIDELSNGFKCRDTSAGINANAGTYIYAAFAESPFKYSLAR